MDFDLETPLPISPERLASLFDIESDHIPSSCTNYYSFRGKIVSLILHFSRNFDDPFLSYLAINYLDRFLSVQPISEEKKPWILKLVSVSCISLAMKMRKTDCSISDIEHDGGIIFDWKSIERMELLILDGLKWRMRSITPFSFINFFISLFKFKDFHSTNALKARATQIIIKAQHDIKLLDFKPSIISASALLSASHELFPLQFPSFKNEILNCSFVNKENFVKSYNVVQGIAMEGYKSVLDMISSSITPSNVLDLYCSCTSSSDTEQRKKRKEADGGKAKAVTVTTLGPGKDLKRRKIEGFKSQKIYTQLSQTQHC